MADVDTQATADQVAADDTAPPPVVFEAVLPAVAVRAVSLFAASNSFRLVLQGIYVEPCEDGVVIVATDGHVLFAVYDELAFASCAGVLDLSPSMLKDMGKGQRETLVVSDPKASLLSLPWNPRDEPSNRELLEMATNPGSLVTNHQWSRACTDLPYPNWRKVLRPAASKLETLAHFNSKLRAKFGNAFQMLSDGGFPAITIAPMEGADPSMSPHYVFGELKQAVGVIMPMRTNIDPTVPGWLLVAGAPDAAAVAPSGPEARP